MDVIAVTIFIILRDHGNARCRKHEWLYIGQNFLARQFFKFSYFCEIFFFFIGLVENMKFFSP